MYKRILIPLRGPAYAGVVLSCSQSVPSQTIGCLDLETKAYFYAAHTRVECKKVKTSFLIHGSMTDAVLAVADAM